MPDVHTISPGVHSCTAVVPVVVGVLVVDDDDDDPLDDDDESLAFMFAPESPHPAPSAIAAIHPRLVRMLARYQASIPTRRVGSAANAEDCELSRPPPAAARIRSDAPAGASPS